MEVRMVLFHFLRVLLGIILVFTKSQAKIEAEAAASAWELFPGWTVLSSNCFRLTYSKKCCWLPTMMVDLRIQRGGHDGITKIETVYVCIRCLPARKDDKPRNSAAQQQVVA